MKILLLALIVSVGLLFLLYRGLCTWTQNNMRNAMFKEGQVPGNTLVTDPAQTGLSSATLRDATLQGRDNLPSPF